MNGKHILKNKEYNVLVRYKHNNWLLQRKLPNNAKKLLSGIEPCISVITQIELFSSNLITYSEKQFLEAFVNICTVYSHLNNDIVNKSIFLRQQNKIKLPDAIIAATALVNNCTIITRNIADFKKIEQLICINPYEL